jgi:hypothetical protein
LSAVRALHIEQGFPDPFSGCLRLQRVLKGIKRCQRSSSDKRLPVTPAILRAICSHLDLSQYDGVMFWAAWYYSIKVSILQEKYIMRDIVC